MEYIKAHLKKLKRLASQHKKSIIMLSAALVSLPILFVTISYLIIAPYSRYTLPADDAKAIAATHTSVGLVLGAGITKSGKPFKELQSRLDTAAAAYEKGQVQYLLLSGDNRFSYYDEPAAMKNYLVQVKHIPADRLQVDDAGRSTYESCERAARVFGLHTTIIFSAKTHLPRATYLCRQFGIQAYGIASPIEANNSTRREILARAKAIFNVYIYGENTILGPPIHVGPPTSSK